MTQTKQQPDASQSERLVSYGADLLKQFDREYKRNPTGVYTEFYRATWGLVAGQSCDLKKTRHERLHCVLHYL
jgi:hypothetical protein